MLDKDFNIKTILLVALFVSFPFLKTQAAQIGQIDVSGFVGVETRIFTEAPNHVGQETDPEASIIINPEFSYSTSDRAHHFSFVPFYRLDSRDEERSHFDIREAYWLWVGDNVEILTGVNRVFWGVTESNHLVNIINQVDVVENIDREDFLGQPMINIATQQDWGRIDTFVLLGFREPSFPGSNGRLRPAIPIDSNNAQFESGAGDQHIDFAARYSHYVGNWDVGLSYFYGTDREPVLTPNDTNTALIPTYNIINQVGLDLQYTSGSWLWKFEGITRGGQDERFFATVGGFEYTFYQIYNNAWDLGVLAEYQYDGRKFTAPTVITDNDVFLGARLALNDVQDTQLLAGFTFDHDTGAQFYNLEAESRLGENYTVELQALIFNNSDQGDPVIAIENDDYIQLRFSRHF